VGPSSSFALKFRLIRGRSTMKSQERGAY